MTNVKKLRRLLPVLLILIGSLLLSSCAIQDKAADPGEWGYDCTVMYDVLGGTINSRGTRMTYYMKNSYVFKPAGTTNMLIEPVRDGYILAGWYTAKEDIKDASGNITDYSFKPEDRWDFDEDRVQGDMTLYARWIPQGKVDYVDASTDEVKFSKNITDSSSLGQLSSAAEMLIAKPGHTFEGYYSDKECTVPYNFTEYTHQELIPSNEDVYAQLQKEFPKHIKKVKYEEPSEDEINPEEDTSDLFINRLGYEITTDDKKERAKIRERKNEIYEDAIQYYIENASSKVVYLKYSEGSYVRVASTEDLKVNGKVWFSGLDKSGNPVDGYTIANDIDFKGVPVAMSEKFSGKILGNGFTLKNITFTINSKKVDQDTSKAIAMFNELDGAYIENLTFENTTVKLSVNSGIPVAAAPLAVQANNTQLKNVRFDGLTIDTGKGDDGKAAYKIGDIYTAGSRNKLENVKGSNITITASESTQVNALIQQ